MVPRHLAKIEISDAALRRASDATPTVEHFLEHLEVHCTKTKRVAKKAINGGADIWWQQRSAQCTGRLRANAKKKAPAVPEAFQAPLM
jgi:hypothetical protein